MTSKQRVKNTLYREKSDRVPRNYHSNPGIDARLKAHFGLRADDHEGLKRALGVDIRGVGARYVGIVQSLLYTCRLQGIDPYMYLVDVLQRIDSHPAKKIFELTPRLWKEKFAHSPMRSDLDRIA